MSRPIAPLILGWSVVLLMPACTSKPEPAKDEIAAAPAPASPSQPAADIEPEPAPEQPTTAAPEPEPPIPEVAPPTEPDSDEPDSDDDDSDDDDSDEPAAVEEIAIKPWSATGFAAQWTLAAEPGQAVALVLDLDAGVLGRAGSTWYQLGADKTLVVAEMDVEPKLPVLGVWPSDAWFIDERMSKFEDSDIDYYEMRLMKLRGGNRWVPQKFSGQQWFHPGTYDWQEAHMSTRSGMLVYPGSLEHGITRVAGKHGDPEIGLHRGTAVDFIENGSGKIYVISHDSDGYYAQIQCEDDECVAAKAQKLPLDSWKFGRKAARGKHSVSVLASSNGREFILHHRGKSDGWLLDELLAGETPQGMWASQEGGLWTLTGAKLRWRDTESVWRDVALPEGLSNPSVALSEDRKQVWISGTVGGAAKLFWTSANAEASP